MRMFISDSLIDSTEMYMRNILLLILKLYLDTNALIHLFNNQISSLFISYNKKNILFVKGITYSYIFAKILTTFTNLRCLKFNSSLSVHGTIFAGMSLETAISSTLLELHINISDMRDLHHILDGRFDQLRILYINTGTIVTHYMLNEQDVGYFVCFE